MPFIQDRFIFQKKQNYNQESFFKFSAHIQNFVLHQYCAYKICNQYINGRKQIEIKCCLVQTFHFRLDTLVNSCNTITGIKKTSFSQQPTHHPYRIGHTGTIAEAVAIRDGVHTINRLPNSITLIFINSKVINLRNFPKLLFDSQRGCINADFL